MDILFSDDPELYTEAIRQIKGLIANPRAWDNLVDGKEKDFIDEFKNYDEFWDFTLQIIDDMNDYNEERLKINKS